MCDVDDDGDVEEDGVGVYEDFFDYFDFVVVVIIGWYVVFLGCLVSLFFVVCFNGGYEFEFLVG